MKPRFPILLTVLTLLLATATLAAQAKELLAGTIVVSESRNINFTLSGEDSRNVIGGEIKLDETSYEITKISRKGVIGATRTATALDGDSANTMQFAIFSSSFSPQTATGEPHIASQEFINCEQAYNSYLAVYNVNKARVDALGDIPYPTLLKDLNSSDGSIVYCFYSQPPNQQTKDSSSE